jgi:hypothetical protein
MINVELSSNMHILKAENLRWVLAREEKIEIAPIMFVDNPKFRNVFLLLFILILT